MLMLMLSIACWGASHVLQREAKIVLPRPVDRGKGGCAW
jgi:hypothetical protein